MSVSPSRCADWPTGRHDRRFRVRFPGPYHYEPGRDGVDETFDVYCLTSAATSLLVLLLGRAPTGRSWKPA